MRIARSAAAPDPDDPDALDPRTVTLVPLGPRWLGVSWPEIGIVPYEMVVRGRDSTTIS